MSVQEYYARYWTADGFNPSGGRRNAYLEEIFRKHLPSPPGTVLDVGCGDGLTSGPVVRSVGLDYQGVDISPTAVEQCSKNGFNGTTIEDISRLPFSDRQFDAAVCIEVIEHLFDPLEAIREVGRVLKPGASLIITTPNTAFWRRRFDYLLLGRFNPYGDYLSIAQPWRDPHIRFFTRRTLGDFLAAAGFAPQYIGGTGGSFWPQLPWLGRFLRNIPTGPIYRGLERLAPAWFAGQLVAVAKKRPG